MREVEMMDPAEVLATFLTGWQNSGGGPVYIRELPRSREFGPQQRILNTPGLRGMVVQVWPYVSVHLDPAGQLRADIFDGDGLRLMRNREEVAPASRPPSPEAFGRADWVWANDEGLPEGWAEAVEDAIVEALRLWGTDVAVDRGPIRTLVLLDGKGARA